MRTPTLYKNFEEIQEDVKVNAPSIVYKYRSWKNDYHRSLLTEQSIWFAHPFTLNDPHDLRMPYKFNVLNFDEEMIYKKILNAGRAIEGDHIPEKLLEIEARKKLDEYKTNPEAYLIKNHREYLEESEHFKRVGLFSTCINGVSGSMWASYGDNHTGFCIGFNTVKLAESLNSGFGNVDYSDEPVEIDISQPLNIDDATEFFQKSTEWSNEEEFRFLKYDINDDSERVIKYPLDAVSEVLLGYQVDVKTEAEIIEEMAKINLLVPVFKLKASATGFGFDKVQIR